jgi:ribosome-binding factor A
MENTKIGRYEKLILRELSTVLSTEKQWILPHVLLTPTDVRLSPDLSIARIQLSILPIEKRPEVLNFCEENKSHIRFLLGQRIRNKMRRIPELYFYLDEFYDKLERINELLKK